MRRNYDNFLDAYFEYTNDGFCPDKFHFWTGISIVAAAMERKCWLPWNASYSVYPNLYVMLVAKPAIGKSTAINKGIGLIKDVNKLAPGSVRLLPSQVTEAKLIELMAMGNYFTLGSQNIPHCSGYYFASEASACLKDITGSTGLVATITALYDCDRLFEKATKSSDIEQLHNVCFNLIAGSTFDYLSELVTDKNIQGGFASRLIYVMQQGFWKRQVSFQDRHKVNKEVIKRDKLVEDLARINQLKGPFGADEEFATLWEDWFAKHDYAVQSNPSPSMQSLLGRKHTTMAKLPMILAAAESSDMTLKAQHFHKALELVESVEAGLPAMIREGKLKDKQSAGGINHAIFAQLKTHEGKQGKSRPMKVSTLLTKLAIEGYDKSHVEKIIRGLCSGDDSSPLRLENGQDLFLVRDPDNYL